MPMQFHAKAMMAATPIAAGEETLQINVNVSWAIKPAQPAQ
jgi:uncharacterized protein YggE